MTLHLEWVARGGPYTREQWLKCNPPLRAKQLDNFLEAHEELKQLVSRTGKHPTKRELERASIGSGRKPWAMPEHIENELVGLIKKARGPRDQTLETIFNDEMPSVNETEQLFVLVDDEDAEIEETLNNERTPIRYKQLLRHIQLCFPQVWKGATRDAWRQRVQTQELF